MGVSVGGLDTMTVYNCIYSLPVRIIGTDKITSFGIIINPRTAVLDFGGPE